VEYLTILNNSKKKDKGKRLLKKVKRATRCHAFEAAEQVSTIQSCIISAREGGNFWYHYKLMLNKRHTNKRHTNKRHTNKRHTNKRHTDKSDEYHVNSFQIFQTFSNTPQAFSKTVHAAGEGHVMGGFNYYFPPPHRSSPRSSMPPARCMLWEVLIIIF
jgi:hypothetical protein